MESRADVAYVLLERGADIDAKDEVCRNVCTVLLRMHLCTHVHVCFCVQQECSFLSQFHIIYGLLYILKQLKTPLHHAAETGRTKNVSLLLQKGADPNVRDKVCGMMCFVYFCVEVCAYAVCIYVRVRVRMCVYVYVCKFIFMYVRASDRGNKLLRSTI